MDKFECILMLLDIYDKLSDEDNAKAEIINKIREICTTNIASRNENFERLMREPKPIPGRYI